MSIIQIEISASTVAWYGAIVATIVMVFKIIEVLRERKKIKLKISKDQRIIGIHGSYPYKEDIDYVCMDIINKGRRRVVIDTAGARLLNGKYIIPADILKSGSISLEEGKRHSVFMEQDKLNFSEISYFYAKDATGDLYKKYNANILKRFFWFIKRLFRLFSKRKK